MALTEKQQKQAEKNRRYWQRREAEALKHRITEEKEYDKRLKQIYADMLDACTKEINGFYGRYASKEGITIAEAKKRVAQADIEAYERKAKRYVREKDFSKEANEEMRLYNLQMKVNRLELLKANIGLELIAGHDELQKFMAEILQGRTEDELKRQAGILGKTITNNAQTAHSIVNASFHNAKFSDRIWMYQGMLKGELDGLLQSGLIQGKNPRELARHLEKRFGVRKSDAERLMRTELARVQTDAQKKSFERNGFEMYTFHVNTGCCDICKELDGKHFKVKDMMPGKNASPMHPHCRCSASAYEDSAEYEAWLDYLDKGGTTAEWQKMQAKSHRKKKLHEGMFVTQNETKADSIRPRSVMNALKKSEIGSDTLEYIKKEGIPVVLGYGLENPNGYSGEYDPFEDRITIYCDVTKTIDETAVSVIHEAMHRKLGGKATKAEEIECFKAEVLHRKGRLTENDINDIIKHVNEAYPELE